MPETTSHYPELQRIANERELLYGGEIVTATIPSLMERKDGGNVFEEGRAFGGMENVGSAEAYVTAAASPHILPCILKDQLLDSSEKVLGRVPVLPAGMESVEEMTPQMVIWWRDGAHDGFADMIYLAGLDDGRKEDFCDVIERQTTKAVQIIGDVSGKPTIWGSWGHGNPDERRFSGRNRGAPTNGHGHLHVIDFNAEEPCNDIEPGMSASGKLNHYEPWAVLLYDTFSGDIAQSIESVLESAKVVPFSETVEANHHVGTINNGYMVEFNETLPYRAAIRSLIEIAGHMETFYKAIVETYTVSHKYRSHPNILELACDTIVGQALRAGFSEEGADKLAEFALKVRPTYSQIVTWLEELEGDEAGRAEDVDRLRQTRDRYDRVRKALSAPLRDDSFSIAMVRDTVAHPDDIRSVGRVWPEHLGSTYVIDDYELGQDGIYVNRIKLIPAVDSTESAPEHITGRVLRRAMSSR